jgi:TetR/AcrR family transcriptional repressor of nem operon
MGRTSDANKRLMDAALSLMWEESYGAVTIDDICKQADVRKGSFYYFFSSKSDLAVQALERMWQEQRQKLDAIFSASIPPIDRIRGRCDAVYEFQIEMKAKYGRVLGCPLCSLGSETCHKDEALSGKVREILEYKICYWDSAIRDAQHLDLIPQGDSLVKARCAMAFFEGMIAQARLFDDVDRLQKLADQMCDHLSVRVSVEA